MAVIDGKKRCPRCGETKAVAGHFYKIGAKQGDGYHGYCISCVKAKAVEWQKANPEKKAASDRKQDQKPERKAKHNARCRKRYHANPKASHQRLRDWVKRNPDRPREWQAKYRERNPGRVKTSQAKYHASDEYKRIHADRERVRRSIRKGGAGGFTRKHWEAVVEEFGAKCAYCDTSDGLTIEHLTPLSRGGKNEPGNIVPACAACNREKWSRTVEEYLPTKADSIRSRALCPQER